MTAHLKSHVLRRDEKGVFGIPFKRLLLSGVGAGLTYTLVNLTGSGASIPIALVTGILSLILSAPRGGIPLWQRLMYRVRGGLILRAHHAPATLTGQIAAALELPLDLAYLPADRLFQSTLPVTGGASAWVLYTSATQTDGFQLLDSPLQEAST